MAPALRRDRVRGPAAYEALFERLREERRGAFVPFTVLGDPDPGTSLAILRTAARSGADAIEAGFPFSDPVADGPAIQAASARALSSGFRMEAGWEILGALRAEFPTLPIGLLVYANLVHRPGVERFYARAAEAGIDSVLVADAPLIESEPLERAGAAHGIAPVLIAPPNAGPERLASIAQRSRGYVYVTARPGVTGAREDLGDDAARVIRRLREVGSPPPLLGFGISKPEHVRKGIAMGAAGAIAGSAVARIIERTASRAKAHGLPQCTGSPQASPTERRVWDAEILLSETVRFVSSMREAAGSIGGG
jgi:tryptophan synthase alpha chain